MSTHNICFHGEIRKIFTGYPPLSRPMSLNVIAFGMLHLYWQTIFEIFWVKKKHKTGLDISFNLSFSP